MAVGAVRHDGGMPLDAPARPTEDTWLTTPRLVLRRPRPTDLDDYVRVHTDPRTYAHAPSSMPTPTQCVERLEADLSSWADEGIGYAAVLDRRSGALIGWAGLRAQEVEGERFFNLYYRLNHDRLGEGLGREIARAVVAWGVEHRPDLPLTALVDQVNAASLSTARAAGLVRIGLRRHVDRPPEDPPMVHFEAPVVEVVRAPDAVADELLDLWVSVNDAGGAVGFVAGSPRAEVAAALDAHLAGVAAGRSLLAVLRDPDGTVRGFGFWEHTPTLPYAHVAVLKRLMVDPGAQGRNLGRLLLGGMVGVVRRELPTVEMLRLNYRSGLGLGDFYASCGWTEVGRVPGGLWLGGDDHRDDVEMARRVDGGPLVGDGRT